MKIKLKMEYPCGAKKEIEISSWFKWISTVNDTDGCPLHGRECKVEEFF